jgi:DNA-binding transcriptional regulator YiaG
VEVALFNTRSRLTAVSREEKIQRGMRIRQLRSALRYSTRKFEAKFAIKASTIKGWERGEGGGLTADGALRLIDVFQKEGLPCTLEWLLYGEGISPFLSDHPDKQKSNTIVQELRFFHQLHPGAIDTVVKDQAMEPRFCLGDYVAGIRLFDRAIDALIGSPCIVQLANGEILVRQLLASSIPGSYTLASINPKASSGQALKTAPVFSAAYVLWVRKPSPF